LHQIFLRYADFNAPIISKYSRNCKHSLTLIGISLWDQKHISDIVECRPTNYQYASISMEYHTHPAHMLTSNPKSLWKCVFLSEIVFHNASKVMIKMKAKVFVIRPRLLLIDSITPAENSHVTYYKGTLSRPWSFLENIYFYTAIKSSTLLPWS